MSNWYVSSTGYTAVAQFATAHAYSIGDIVRQLATPAVGSERCFRCTTAGTSGGSESAWTLTKAATTAQGTATFTEVTGNETYQSPGAWAAPHARLGNPNGAWGLVAGDTLYVAANHAESTAATVTLGLTSFTPASIICVDNSGTGHVPPAAGDTRTTASITITGGFNTLQFAHLVGYFYGLNIVMNGSNSTLYHGQAGSAVRFESCTFAFTLAGTLNPIANAFVEWLNCQYTPFAATSALTINARVFRWRNPSGLAPVGGVTAMSSYLFTDGAAVAVALDALNFSALAHVRLITSASTNPTNYSVTDCKLHASTIFSQAPAATASTVDFFGTDSAALTYRNERWAYMATLTTDAAVVHTGGASDGTTTTSWKVVTNASAAQRLFFEAFPIAQWNALTGSAKTVSFEAVVNAAAVLTNAQLWMDVAYFGTAGSVLASIDTTGAAALASATNLTASTTAWDSQATARANSAAKVLGDAIAVSSNTGRIFFCTTAGTTSGSLPAGYATAVDGGSVTDGTAVFRAGCRMTVSLSITPQVAGLIRVTPKVGVASTTLYVDPLLTVA